ncbi:MAG: type II toxin-antitoxin system RelE/ParE family toxin [Pseudomonadota bacterium]
MTTHEVLIALRDEGDIRDAIDWYKERNALVADSFRSEVFDAIERIAVAPLGKAADEEGNRRRVLHRFPYSVVFEVVGTSVTVLAVAHHRPSPRYWRAKQS